MQFKQIKLTSADFYNKEPDIAEAVLAAEDPLHDMLRLAGLPPATNVLEDEEKPSGRMSPLGSNISITGMEKKQLEKEHNIKPGTDEWFRLWFSRPFLTSETPVKTKPQ